MVRLKAACKDYLWGGTVLRDRYGKGQGMDRVAESWELSAHPAGASLIDSGPDAGLRFPQYLEKYGPDCVGSRGAAFSAFPVLIKWIDAKLPLSVQVHPSDDYALKAEGEFGKTEMWYVLDCDPGASLYFGVNQTLTKEELRRRIQDESLTQVLRERKVHPGDMFFIESGTLHAIGGGILICEIQQNSNTTYRVYDYGRRDEEGNSRPLHVEKAMAVARLVPSPMPKEAPVEEVRGGTRQSLASCPYFQTALYETRDCLSFEVTKASFSALNFVKGTGTVNCGEVFLDVQAGDSLFVPAGSGTVTVTGDCRWLETEV